jgi:3D (Asp-Asp-Asp) domain-containing protein
MFLSGDDLKYLALCLFPFVLIILISAASGSKGPEESYSQHPLYQDEPVITTHLDSDAAISSTPIPEIVEEPIEVVQPKGEWVWARVTAYCPCEICCGKEITDPAYGITSTQVNVLSGNPNDAYGIAADPRAVPYGTTIYVPEYWESLQRNRTFIPTDPIQVDDTGGGMRRSWSREGVIHLDVRYRTHSAAQNWGRRWMRVFIYDD